MVPETDRFVRRLTFALVVLASMATEIAADDLRPVSQSLGLAMAWVALAVIINGFIPLPANSRATPPRWIIFPCLGLAALPFVIEPFRRDWTGAGYPLELQMVAGFRNMALGFAACAGWRLCLRLACVSSLFLMLFAVIMTNHRGTMPVLGLYGAAGSVWLAAVHWSGLRQFFVAGDNALSLDVSGGRPAPLPKLALALGLLVVGGVIALTFVGPQQIAGTLGELFPTSGGTGGFDPFARGGIGDGDDETKGKSPKSTGMTQSDTFLDTPLPSLYDLISDMYGEPYKIQEQERSIALDPLTMKALESQKKPADNLRPNREFAAGRTAPRQNRDMSDRTARAMFEVEGRTPLHLRLTAYDGFDGRVWREAPAGVRQVLLEKEETGHWMRVVSREPPEAFAPPERHRFKLTAPEGPFLPTPPHTTRFWVAMVNDPNFYGWGQDRILRFAERNAPAGTVLETECRVVEPKKLVTVNFPVGRVGERFLHSDLPPDLSPEIPALAREWTRGLPPGWPQIAAIIDRLKSEYAVEAKATDPRDPLGEFLFHSRRGPDYLFASATAILVRSLGYPTRLVSGFYVSPEAYDPVTRHTPVVREDLHFWAEVMLPGGDWLVLESTPGHHTLAPEISLSERLLLAASRLGTWAQEHAIEIGIGIGMALLGFMFRRRLRDRLAVWRWHFIPVTDWRANVTDTVRLLERRGGWAGKPRAGSETQAVWLRRTGHEELIQLSRIIEWAAYAGPLPAPWPVDEVRQVCRDVVRAWTVRRWRETSNIEEVIA
ncbi:transglutaminase-like domain-containing protein [Zavarzinella formosa]|uniref:transglutaminase-like domain-containing protein n=1 Tax=Zavarzinella formosa TaxID=360055 RepID=UPI0002EEC4AF|nr:transglutaminase-like domain-containing protein [Zavarzinella formosa]